MLFAVLITVLLKLLSAAFVILAKLVTVTLSFTIYTVPISLLWTIAFVLFCKVAVETDAIGNVVSIVTDKLEEADDSVPDTVCFAVIVWDPSESVDEVIDQFPEPSAVVVPKIVVPSVSYKVIVAPDTALLPLKVGVLSFVISSVWLLPLSVPAVILGALGAVGFVIISTLVAELITFGVPSSSCPIT